MLRPLANSLLALALACLAACGSDTSEGAAGNRPEPVPVTVARVVSRDVPIQVHAIGTVSARATVALKSQVDGQLAEVRFREGQEVKRGDVLFVIDPRPFEAALHEAEARLARDRAAAANAASELKRFERLMRDGVVSADEHERARTAAAVAAASVRADEAAVETARIRLQYCTIYAPIDGRIGEALVHAGNVIKANDSTLAVINQVRPVDVEFSVPQQELPAIRQHMAQGPLSVRAKVQGAPDESAHGTLVFVDNAVDTATGTVRLKAEFPNDDERLWPGQFAEVWVHVETRAGALVIPGRAVQAGQQGRFVYVVKDDGTVEPHPVEVESIPGEDVIVKSGLAAGERVVTDGQLRLAPGMPVTPLEQASSPETPAA